MQSHDSKDERIHTDYSEEAIPERDPAYRLSGGTCDDPQTVEQLPAAPPKEKISAAVDQLLTKYSPEAVAVYLHAFRDMDSEVQWPPLDAMLSEDSRLKLGS